MTPLGLNSATWRLAWEEAIRAIASVPEQEFDADTIAIIAGNGGSERELGDLFAELIEAKVIEPAGTAADGHVIFRGVRHEAT